MWMILCMGTVQSTVPALIALPSSRARKVASSCQHCLIRYVAEWQPPLSCLPFTQLFTRKETAHWASSCPSQHLVDYSQRTLTKSLTRTVSFSSFTFTIKAKVPKTACRAFMFPAFCTTVAFPTVLAFACSVLGPLGMSGS